MPKEVSEKSNRIGLLGLKVHTHIGGAMDRLLNGNPYVIKGMRLYANEKTVNGNHMGEYRKDDQTPDGRNYGIDYSLSEIPITSLADLGLYLSTGIRQLLRIPKKD